MGAVLAKFRKPKTTIEILENLEQNIKNIEEYSISTQARQKRYVGNFLVISIGLYILGFIIFYFAFFPPTWMERVTYSIPLLIFPLIIFLVKRLVAWYFQRKLNKNSRELNKLRGEKKKIIERVMEKETYKVAIEILNRFADKSNGFKTIGVVTPRSKPLTPVPTSQQQQQQLLTTINYQQVGVERTPLSIRNTLTASNQHLTPQRNDITFTSSNEGIVALRNPNYQLQKRKTPFPIINQQQQGVLEKIVDYLIGDGPHNRFAMICKECYAHNGMALQEEFEYSAFRCAFCNALNPSRKSRPIGPKLPSTSSSLSTNVVSATGIANALLSASQINSDDKKESSSTSTSERESDPESDEAMSVQPLDKPEATTETDNIEKEVAKTTTTTTDFQQETTNETEKSSIEKKND